MAPRPAETLKTALFIIRGTTSAGTHPRISTSTLGRSLMNRSNSPSTRDRSGPSPRISTSQLISGACRQRPLIKSFRALTWLRLSLSILDAITIEPRPSSIFSSSPIRGYSNRSMSTPFGPHGRAPVQSCKGQRVDRQFAPWSPENHQPSAATYRRSRGETHGTSRRPWSSLPGSHRGKLPRLKRLREH